MCAYSSVQHDKSRVGKEFTPDLHLTNIEFRVPYSQRYLFNAIPDTNHNANLTNPNLTVRITLTLILDSVVNMSP